MSRTMPPKALQQALALLAEVGRPLTAMQVADLLRINAQTAWSRLRRLSEEKLAVRERSADGKQVLWRAARAHGSGCAGFERHSYGTCLAALEKAVRGWYGLTCKTRHRGGER